MVRTRRAGLVTITIDTQALANLLGARALLSAGKRARALRGCIRARASEVVQVEP
jgi:hypothetical protein